VVNGAAFGLGYAVIDGEGLKITLETKEELAVYLSGLLLQRGSA
jgi:hypothetical protein